MHTDNNVGTCTKRYAYSCACGSVDIEEHASLNGLNEDFLQYSYDSYCNGTARYMELSLTRNNDNKEY